MIVTALKISNFRRVERAYIDLTQQAVLIAAPNGGGKTSIIEAARIALTNEKLVTPDVLVKEAKLLLHKGSDKAEITLFGADDKILRQVTIPFGGLIGDGIKPISLYAAGIQSIADLAPSARVAPFSAYVPSIPSVETLIEAMKASGLPPETIERACNQLKENGWDKTFEVASDYSRRLVSTWEKATGEKFGAKKAEDWKPENWDLDPASKMTQDEVIATQAQKIAAYQMMVENGIMAADVLARLQADIDAFDPLTLPKLEQEIEDINNAIAYLNNKRAKLAVLAEDPCECPHCGKAVTVDLSTPHTGERRATLKIATEVLTADKRREIRADIAESDGALTRKQGELRAALARKQEAVAVMERHNAAKARIGDLEASEDDIIAMQEAKQEEERWRASVHMLARINEAKATYATWKNIEVIKGLFGPEGLKKRELAKNLSAFNSRLSTICKAFGWPDVWVGADLDLNIEEWPMRLASKSHQYRIRIALQCAQAQIDGDPIVIIDEWDMINKGDRHKLFAGLRKVGLKAIVAMTVDKEDDVPPIDKAKLGLSYWISDGIVRRVGETV